MIKIAQASINENGKVTGGKLGNQNGKELNIKELKKNTFKYVIRFIDNSIANNMTIIAKAGVANKHIGYDQGDRNSLWRIVKNPTILSMKGVNVDCGCDCSSFVSVCAELAYYSIHNKFLPNFVMDGNAPTTMNMLKKFKNTGIVTTFDKLSISELKKGDILVTPGKHTVLVVEV